MGIEAAVLAAGKLIGGLTAERLRLLVLLGLSQVAQWIDALRVKP